MRRKCMKLRKSLSANTIFPRFVLPNAKRQRPRRQGALIGVEISANAFLQHMVRNIVGSLIYVGTGRESVQWLADVLHAKSRAVAAPTFDPSGLYLTGVEYPSQLELPVGGLSPFVF